MVPEDERCGPLLHGGPCLLRKGHKGEHNAWADLHSANAIQWRDERIAKLEKELANGGVESLRASGWSVAVHNDYKIHGVPHTFWLFTHADGRWIKGEGRTDADAIAAARAMLTKETH